jgi:hypothetical protein
VILWNTKSFQKAPLSAALPSHLYHLLCLERQASLNLEPVLDQILRPHLGRRPLAVITTYTCKGDHWIHSSSLGLTAVLTGNALRNTWNFTTMNPRSSRASKALGSFTFGYVDCPGLVFVVILRDWEFDDFIQYAWG